MKQKCSFILRSSIALLLTALMIIGSISTVLAATVDMADIGRDADLANTGYTEYNLGSSNQFYFDNSSTKWSSVKLMVMKKNGGSWSGGPWDLTQVSGTDYWYWDGGQSWNGYTHYLFYSGDWGNATQTNDIEGELAGSSWYSNCFTPSGGSSSAKWGGSFDKCVGVKNFSVTASNTNSGSGTSASPYLVNTGASITLTASATAIDTNCAVNYKFNSGSYSTTTITNTFNASSTANTEFTKTVTVKTTRGNYSSREETKTIYFKTVQPVTNYTGITAVAKGTTDGTNYSVNLGTIQSSTTVSSSTGLAVSAGTQSGYTFYKWVASGSGTFDDANNASTTFHPAANDEVATAQFKKNYTITENTPTSGTGTISIDYTSRVAGEQYVVTLSPAAGYKVDTFTVGGVDKKSSISDNKYTGTASGSDATIEVNVTYAPITDMQLYIAGRFRVRPSAGSSSWTTTYSSNNDWNETSTNIPFTYLSGTTYKVDTYASLKELSAKPKNNQDPWFFVYDKTNSKAWHPTTQNRELGTTTEYDLTTNTATYNVRFNSSSDDSPVTIYFDYNTKRLWYTIPDLYDVTVSTATGGEVTASPARCEEGATVELTIAPTTGYQLKSISAKDSSNATVTLSGTDNTRTFTMPAKNVTVTPVFEKISYSVSVAAKYSNNGTDFDQDFESGSEPTVTIGANIANQIDGTTVAASDKVGYVFVGWATNTGSTTQFGNQLDKVTTFKPTSGNTQAIARYKKIFTITSSVDNTGTGAGTVTTSETSVEAGGSYTITANAANGSAIESIKVNDGTGTTTSPRTVSSVSADQTVVVKFKSNVKIGYRQFDGTTSWNESDMTVQSDGTYIYQFNNVPSGRKGQFKAKVGDSWKEVDLTYTDFDDGATSCTLDSVNDGGVNYRINTTEAVNVKVIFNATVNKISKVIVDPVSATTYAITVGSPADAVLTATYRGTEYAEGQTINARAGQQITFSATTAESKYVSGYTLGGAAVTSPHTVAASDNGKTLTCSVADKLTIKAVTNKSARGTVTVDKSFAAPGETIKITVTPLAGSLKSLTAVYGNGYTYEYKNGAWSEVANTTGSALPSKLFSKIVDIAATGAELDEAAVAAMADIVPVGASQEINMTLEQPSSVTINALFDPYSAESTWYYNGYDTSGNALSSYHGKQMTEGMVGGEKFSYYHVEGRTGTDQLMTVSNGAASSGTRYIYFTASSVGGWSTDENHQYAYFYNGSGNAGNAWPGYKMTKYTTNEYGQNVYRVEIPTSSSPTGVVFNNASNAAHKTTNVTDLTKGGYYLLSTHYNDNGTEVHDWQSYDCTYPSAGYSSGTEYFYSNSIYTADFSTKGFYNHNTNSKDFTKPKDLGNSTGDYYVNVLYAGKTYTINGVTTTVGSSNPLVIWSAEPLAGDDENVTVYAKDGSIRSESYGSTYANIANTKIYDADGTTAVGTNHTGNITDQTYETVKSAKGETIVIKTQIGANDSGNLSNAADLKAKYYVRGFCVNGEVSQLLEWNADGLYTLTFKVPEDGDITKFEITPIYYLKDTTNNPIVTYRVTGFTDELKAVGAGKPGWGDTLYTYPYYGKLGSNNNALGAYPGQPMVYYKGQYQMQIPQNSTAWDIYYDDSALSGYSDNTAKANAVANTTVSGVTMSNGYYDIVHRQIMGYGSNGASSDHVQTYDYGDFFKIFNEKEPVDNIVFDFKYRTKKHNFENQPATTISKSDLDTNYGTNGNGFELLTNFHGRHVDLFGTPLSGDAADPNETTPVYVVSIGGVNGSAGVENVAGYYATEWMVYGSSDGTNYSRITAGNKNSIPPEILILNDDDATSFNTTTYPSADANHTVDDWKALYTALEAYRGKPVMISYEAADAQIGAGNYATSGGGGATRNDGRWLYSKNGESITSTIKIQYSDDNGANYTDLNTTTPQVSGLSAYFTNDGVEGEMTYSTIIDPDKTFDFEAKTTNGNYKFVGWYMDDGTKITSDNVSHTERSGSYTFVAKFMQVQSGQLILSHSADKDTISGTDYQGAGTAKIGVVVKNGDEVIRTIDLSTSDITLDDKIIKSDSTYTIDVTLEATATGNDTYGTTVLANPSGGTATYFSEKSSTTSGKTKTIVLNSFTVGSLFSGTTQNVKNIIYHSYFNQAVFSYTLTFSYKDRFDVSKSFTRQGQLTSAQAANASYVEQSDGSFSLLPAFMQTVAPFESNVGENITWNFNKAAFTPSGSTYTCTATINATQTKSNKRNVTFKLPYEHTNGIANGGNSGTAAEAPDFALTGDNAVDVDTIPVLLNNAVNGIYNEDGKKNLIAAPATIDDNGTPKYFQYWSVKSTSADKEGDPEVARCYFQGFNFCALDNYTVTPIYDTQKTDISNSGIYTGASYLETSRNQWNDNQDRAKTEYNAASDLLYNDFILNYNFKGVDIYKGDSDSEDILELGVVVERVKELDINQDGSKNTDISNYTSVAENLDTVRDIINGTTTDNKYYKDTIQKTWLDNKNRAKFYEAFYNGRGWSMENQSSAAKYAYRNYVYRAYTYIKYKDDQNNTQIKLSEKPAYFTMYNEAVADYTVPTSGN